MVETAGIVNLLNVFELCEVTARRSAESLLRELRDLPTRRVATQKCGSKDLD